MRSHCFWHPVKFACFDLAKWLRFQFWVNYSLMTLFINIFPHPTHTALRGHLSPSCCTSPREIKTPFSLISHISSLCPVSFRKKKQNAPLRGVTGNFLSGPADNYKEHRRENNRNLVASNGAGSQTVRKPFLQVSHPILISIYNAAERRRLARLNCLW